MKVKKVRNTREKKMKGKTMKKKLKARKKRRALRVFFRDFSVLLKTLLRDSSNLKSKDISH